MLEIDCGTLLGNLLWVNDYELIIFGFHMGTYRWCFWNVIWPSGVPWKKFWSCCPDPIMKQKESVYFSFCSICFLLLIPFFWLISFIVFTFSLLLSKKEKDMLHHFKIFTYGVTSSVFLMTKRSLNCSKHLSHSLSYAYCILSYMDMLCC